MKQLHRFLFLVVLCILVVAGVHSAYGGLDSLGVWSQNLPNSARVYTMDISSTNGNLIYCAGLDSGVYKSTNAGASWVAVNNGLTYNHVQAIAMSQSNNSIIYCGTDQNGGANSGVYVSTDAGATWTLSINGISDVKAIQSLAVDPTNPSIAFVATFDGINASTVGIFKTTDRGANWIADSTGLTNKNILSLAINPLNPNVIYAGSSLVLPGSTGPSKMFKSVNGGATWADISNGLPTNTTTGDPVRALSISRADTSRVLAALFMNDTAGGAYLTTNGGVTWAKKHNGLGTAVGTLLRACLIKPGSTSEFYVGIDGGGANLRGVWRTTDGGENWSDFNNGTMVNTFTIRALVFKTQGNPTLYAGTANAAVAVAGRGVYEYSWAAPPAPTVLLANPGPANNGGSAGWAMFLNLIAGPLRVTVTDMTTASTAAANATYSVEILTRSGTALGGPVGSGPGSSTAGWTSIGTAPVTQGPVASGVSLLFPIPNIIINPGDTVGVAIRFTGAGPRYFGTGSPPYNTYSDANLTLVTGDGRSVPFTTTGTWFASRALVGEVHYTTTTVDVKEPGQEIPVVFALLQNYPNPFNPTTTLRYTLPTVSNVTMKIYNVLGQEMITLRDELQEAGTYNLAWDGKNASGERVASGVCFYRLEARAVDGSSSFSSIKKMLLLK